MTDEYPELDEQIGDLYAQIDDLVAEHPVSDRDDVAMNVSTKDFGDAKFVNITAYDRT